MEGITFPGDEAPSISVFKGVLDRQEAHIVYDMNKIANKSKIIKIIKYQYVCDAKTPLLQITDSKQRLKNCNVCELEPTLRIVFFEFEPQ